MTTHTTSYQFKKLGTADIGDYMRLQQSVIPQSTVNGVCRIKPRNEDYLIKHMKDMAVLGYVDKDTGELAATAMVTHPDHPCAQYMNGYPFNEKLSDIFVVQGLYVSPKHQKKGLSCLLLDKAFNEAAITGRYIGYAKTGSEASQKSFTKCGFHVAACGVDTTFGYGVTFMRKEERIPITRNFGMPLSLPAGSQFRYI